MASESTRRHRLVSLQSLTTIVSSPRGTNHWPNICVTLVCQLFTSGLAIALDALGFSDATAVIIYALGVLFTAILTVGRWYSLVASVISVFSYNFFLIAPRFSLQIDGRDYAGTITAMFLFALIESYLVDNLRRTARESMEATLVAEREQLRANMLRSVSHDLRTPLTSISGNADMLLDEDAVLDASTRQQLLQDIYDDATWLTTTVQNLLAVTRLEDGTLDLKMDIELIDDVIEEAMRHVSRDANKHVITVEPSQQLLLARMDPQVIVQVIVNLVNNAIAHTQEGSHISISTHRSGDYAVISVADDGPGVPDADKQQIFDSFYTSRARGADVGRSIGLGLALCRSIIEAHKGTIYVEDVEPHGARFSFTLPIEEVPVYV